MSALPTRKPFLPSDIVRPPAGQSVSRAALAVLLNSLRRGSSQTGAEGFARERWPNDHQTLAVVKAATSPASTSGTGWAAETAPTAVADFLGSIEPESAGAKLVAAGTKLSLAGVSALTIPMRSALPATDASWVLENGAIPVRQGALTTTTLGPAKKLAAIATLSREVAEHAAGEAVIRQILGEDLSASLDATLFSNVAATGARNAGLLNGVSGQTATTGGGETALRGDLNALVNAVSGSGGLDGIVLIASPATAVRASLYRTSTDNLTIWSAAPGAIAAGTVIAIQTRAFVSAFPGIQILTAVDAVLHMDDASPLAISTTGSPNVVSAPARSLFQTDTIGIRAVVSAAWTMRAPSAVSFVTSVSW